MGNIPHSPSLRNNPSYPTITDNPSTRSQQFPHNQNLITTNIQNSFNPLQQTLVELNINDNKQLQKLNHNLLTYCNLNKQNITGNNNCVLEYPSISKLKEYYRLKKQGYCTNNYMYYLIFDVCSCCGLKQQMGRRKLQGITFSDYQIINILKTLLTGLSVYMKKFNRWIQKIDIDDIAFQVVENIDHPSTNIYHQSSQLFHNNAGRSHNAFDNNTYNPSNCNKTSNNRTIRLYFIDPLIRQKRQQQIISVNQINILLQNPSPQRLQSILGNKHRSRSGIFQQQTFNTQNQEHTINGREDAIHGKKDGFNAHNDDFNGIKNGFNSNDDYDGYNSDNYSKSIVIKNQLNSLIFSVGVIGLKLLQMNFVDDIYIKFPTKNINYERVNYYIEKHASPTSRKNIIPNNVNNNMNRNNNFSNFVSNNISNNKNINHNNNFNANNNNNNNYSNTMNNYSLNYSNINISYNNNQNLLPFNNDNKNLTFNNINSYNKLIQQQPDIRNLLIQGLKTMLLTNKPSDRQDIFKLWKIQLNEFYQLKYILGTSSHTTKRFCIHNQLQNINSPTDHNSNTIQTSKNKISINPNFNTNAQFNDFNMQKNTNFNYNRFQNNQNNINQTFNNNSKNNHYQRILYKVQQPLQNKRKQTLENNFTQRLDNRNHISKQNQRKYEYNVQPVHNQINFNSNFSANSGNNAKINEYNSMNTNKLKCHLNSAPDHNNYQTHHVQHFLPSLTTVNNNKVSYSNNYNQPQLNNYKQYKNDFNTTYNTNQINRLNNPPISTYNVPREYTINNNYQYSYSSRSSSQNKQKNAQINFFNSNKQTNLGNLTNGSISYYPSYAGQTSSREQHLNTIEQPKYVFQQVSSQHKTFKL